MEHVVLVGVEQVQSAGNRMIAASDEMHRSANLISESLRTFISDFRDQIDRLEVIHGNTKDNK